MVRRVSSATDKRERNKGGGQGIEHDNIYVRMVLGEGGGLTA